MCFCVKYLVPIFNKYHRILQNLTICHNCIFRTSSNVSEDEIESDIESEVESSQSILQTPPSQSLSQVHTPSSSSNSSSRVISPSPMPKLPRPIKRVKKNMEMEGKLFDILHKPDAGLKEKDGDAMFCLSLADSLREITNPRKKAYAKLQLQKCLYDCVYGSDEPTPNSTIVRPKVFNPSTAPNPVMTPRSSSTPIETPNVWPNNDGNQEPFNFSYQHTYQPL